MMLPLIPIHSDDSLLELKLNQFAQSSTESLINSLLPGNEGSLKVRPDGIMLDGHHRIKILRDRGVDVDALPREIIPKNEFSELEGEGSKENMTSTLYWIPVSASGRLALVPRPRGGDWLEDEIAEWKRQGVDVVVSLLTNEELIELGLVAEEELIMSAGLQFFSLPILDRGIPEDGEATYQLTRDLAEQLTGGQTIAIHCRQSIGRAGLVAASVLVELGMRPQLAIDRISASRGLPIPETSSQLDWILGLGTAKLQSSML